MPFVLIRSLAPWCLLLYLQRHVVCKSLFANLSDLHYSGSILLLTLIILTDLHTTWSSSWFCLNLKRDSLIHKVWIVLERVVSWVWLDRCWLLFDWRGSNDCLRCGVKLSGGGRGPVAVLLVLSHVVVQTYSVAVIFLLGTEDVFWNFLVLLVPIGCLLFTAWHLQAGLGQTIHSQSFEDLNPQAYPIEHGSFLLNPLVLQIDHEPHDHSCHDICLMVHRRPPHPLLVRNDIPTVPPIQNTLLPVLQCLHFQQPRFDWLLGGYLKQFEYFEAKLVIVVFKDWGG